MSQANANSGETVTGQQLAEWRQSALQIACSHSVDPYEVDWLLQGSSDLSNAELRLETFQTRPQISLKFALDTLTQKWQQRVSDRVPIQYLAGETPWRDLMLTVTPAVLIPRPETELIIDIVLQRMQTQRSRLKSGVWVDMGTGSGAIAIALARALPQATVLAVENSQEALAIARENAQRNGAERIAFHQGSWFEPISQYRGKLAGLVTNPPYIPSREIGSLDLEVQHEPRQALDGGTNGLVEIEHLARAGAAYLQPGGLWVSELMRGQAPLVEQCLEATAAYAAIEWHRDLAGTERFVSAYRSRGAEQT